ncbi:aldo/keto reductase [Altererythrobacter salegens]|uniref:Aldo/keto reductase n=1 Tax=Croceibacterium salegens TaxID=1737568 RepID=A0A6I4SWM6_9SPHN|nr:aldo/keto reductase [Croceibacterium salegens]MXO59437.1 aldo/keto reductase [Croceibacterium salegens]
MQTVRLGRTDAQVSVVGLGCGGHSRLGMARGASSAQAAEIVRRAIDLGVTFIDTAHTYGTEEAVGLGIAGHDRSSLFISTKSWVGKSLSQTDPENLTPDEFTASLEESLRKLGTDYVDLFHLHGVSSAQLPYAREVILPELRRHQESGKIRFIGITEAFRVDTSHDMLQQAVPTGDFDVVMAGFNMLNPGARETLFPLTMAHDVGTLIMFAVRRGLNSVANAAEAVAELIGRGEIDSASVNSADPLDFLRATPDVKSQVEAAYRFCRHEPGAHVVLTGTGDAAHLEENIASILAPPLPAELLERLDAIFGKVTSASGE